MTRVTRRRLEPRSRRLSSIPSERGPAPEPQRLTWAEFQSAFVWNQGEHVSLIGPTGCGKTTLAAAILGRREYVVAFGTKPWGYDPPLDHLHRVGWRRVEEWTPRPGERRLLLWPKFREPADMVKQQRVFRAALRTIFTERAWCVYIDEARYVVHTLRLGAYLKLYWQMGRSLRLSLVTTTQRPAHMPLEMYDQATHLFMWRETDRVNLTRLSGLGGALDARQVAQLVATLPEHEFLYVNTRTGQLIVSACENGG